MYQTRWEIEIINNFYKNELLLNDVREHDDYSLYGSEFINMLSVIIGNSMKNDFALKGLFEKYTYNEIIKFLNKGKKFKDLNNKDTWYDVTCQTKKGIEVYKILGI